MLRYYITARHALGGEAQLLEFIACNLGRFDIIQIREKDLPARGLARLTRQVVGLCGSRLPVLVNDRADIAAACGAAGVHLPARSLPAHAVRSVFSRPALVSVACHSLADVKRAAREGASYALLSPIFDTPGKGPPLGLEVLAQAARLPVPVLALGGVTPASVPLCHAAGAAGVAAIRLFQCS